MEESLISIIVPAYQAEQWLQECCQSVCEQIYKNWELIIVDDGSQDATLAVAEAQAQKNKQIQVIHTDNGGVCRARNIGMDMASGQYIMFLDADDLLLPDALQFLYRLLRENDADIAIGQKRIFKQDGCEFPCCYDADSYCWEGTEALQKSLEDHPATYSVWGKLYRRELLEDIRFVPGRKIHEDSFFLFQCLLKQPKVVVRDRTVLRYRMTDNSASRSPFSEKMLDILYFADEKTKCIQEQYPQYIPLVKNLKIKANMALLRNLCKTTEKKYRNLEKSCICYILKHKKCFIPATQADKKWFWIISHHMYKIYKLAYLMTRKRRK